MFTLFIAQVERDTLAKAIDKDQFVAVLSDGSTDSSVREQELFYIRYVDNGNINVKFFACINVERPDSQSIYAAMKQGCRNILDDHGRI